MADQLNLPNTQPLTTVEGYQFEPIKGYPMLHWKGKRPFTSTQYYPAQIKEVHGAEVEGWRSKIYWGDNLQVMSHLLKEFRGKVNLVYIDPPFDSKADYKRKIQLKNISTTNNLTAFEEKQYTDIWSNDEYLQFMYERLILIRELLSESGSIYLHCDYRKSHLLRSVLDEIFSPEKLLNEIIWEYRTGGVSDKFFARKHDSILVYKKGEDYQFNCLEEKTYIPTLANRTFAVEELGAKVDEKGCPNCGLKGQWYKMSKMRDVWAVTPLFRNSQERLDYPTQKPEALLERIIRASSNPDDIVFDCFMGSGTTQAVAMKLGRRFIGADINLGAVQITTKRLLGVAEELENQAQSAKVLQLPIPQAASKLRLIDGGKEAGLGDTSRAADSGGTYSTAEDEAEADLEQTAEPTTYYTGFEVYNVNHYDVFRNPLEAKDLLLEALEVNRLTQGNLFDGEKDGRMVKIMPVNRIATRADLNELIAGFDYKAFEKRYQEHPHAPVEKITLICMGHEPDLAAQLKKEVKPFELDVEVVDILRDKQEIQFKRDSEASIVVKGNELVIEAFYPMNLLGKLSLQQENVEDWRELVESVMIDWNYDGAIFQPLQVDIPSKNELVSGRYPIPDDAGTIRIKITDLLSESLEVEVEHG
ncbi:site-specific DNA-methyltransferase [Synechococcus elongatus]|uniref:Site-specific DNA-methyltransferase n=1 Tax=Synechococcus elongatus PCC 11802 TaxID=2283154 RepID=A0AAU6R4U7_SYNEL|nr:site-specific DNA-methyltransferase [Synechococcus elongatus]